MNSNGGERRSRARFAWVLLVLGSAFVAHADGGLPHVFMDGTPALADEVNANFFYLQNRIDSAAEGSTRVIYVDALPFAHVALANGTALREALDRIQGAGPNNRYKIVLRPGVYDLGDETVHIPTYTSVVGASVNLTTIVSRAKTAITMDALSSLDRLSIQHHSAENTIVIAPNPLGGATYLRDVNIQSNSNGDLTVLKSTLTITLFLQDVWISAIGSGDLVGLDSSGTGFVDASDLMLRVRNNDATGSTTALLLGSQGNSRFMSSQLQVTGGGKDLPLWTTDAFNGVVHFIGSRFITEGEHFARIEGIVGSVYVAASEIATGYYERKSTAEIHCARNYTSAYNDTNCNTVPF